MSIDGRSTHLPHGYGGLLRLTIPDCIFNECPIENSPNTVEE